METSELFEKHDDEFLKFDRIPEYARKHPRRDICAFIYLHDRFGGTGTIICASEHDEFYLDCDESIIEQLTDEDVIYLSRCGVMFNGDSGSLSMFS